MFLGRKKELQEIQQFISEPGSGLVHIRGRRRVGKSTILQYFEKELAHCFYFSGSKDSTSEALLNDFARQFDPFSRSSSLSQLRKEYLGWDAAFKAVAVYARAQPIVVILDEIQWIAKKGAGVLGRLKEAWLAWKNTGNIKLIICGSSNKFFQQQTGGEHKILRGLKTHSDIWINPFSLREVQTYYFPQLSQEEVTLIYMIVGGIPYYLEQFPKDANFIRIVNDTLFTKKTIFLDEYKEVLNLDFNSSGLATVSEMLELINFTGRTQAQLQQMTGMAESGVRYYVDKLIDYSLLFKRKNSLTNKSGKKNLYYLKDFYLNFYFQLLSNLAQKVRVNQSRLIFAQLCIQSNAGYYIPNFSGPGFELLAESVLEDYSSMTPNIFKTLNLRDVDYEVFSKVKSKNREIDILIKCPGDREIRMIEVKWVNENGIHPQFLDQASTLAVELPKGYKASRFLLLSTTPTKSFIEQAAAKGVGILTLKDLF